MELGNPERLPCLTDESVDNMECLIENITRDYNIRKVVGDVVTGKGKIVII